MWKTIAFIGVVAIAAAAVWLFEGDIPAAEVDAAYGNAASRFLDLADGTRVHYRDQGNPNGLALVLVHGSNASLHTWESWVGQLGDTYRVITLDLPGHGLTGRTPADDYSSEAFIATVNAVVDHLSVDSFVMGGNSMGGGVTWRYTLAHPQRVQGMILVDASPPWAWRQSVAQDDSRSDSGPLFFRLIGQGWFRAVARYLDSRSLVEQGLYASHYDPAIVTEALIDRYYTLSMRAGTRAATLQRFKRRGASQPTPVDLATLTQPTLVMWGKYDNLIPVSVGEQFEQVLPNAELVVYDNIGHIPMEETVVRSAADVRRFVETLP